MVRGYENEKMGALTKIYPKDKQNPMEKQNDLCMHGVSLHTPRHCLLKLMLYSLSFRNTTSDYIFTDEENVQEEQGLRWCTNENEKPISSPVINKKMGLRKTLRDKEISLLNGWLIQGFMLAVCPITLSFSLEKL